MNSFQLRGEESQLIVDSWERRESLTSLLQAKEESKRNILKYGDHLSAIRYVASCTALIAHKIRREAKEKEVRLIEVLQIRRLKNTFLRLSKVGVSWRW